MVTARYSSQQGSKSRQNPCQVQPTENIGNFSGQDNVFVYELQFLLSGLLPVFVSYRDRRLSDVLPIHQNKLIKSDSKTNYRHRRATRRHVMRNFTSSCTDQCQNGSSNLFTPCREQPRSARVVVAYPRLVFSATKRTNHAL